VSAWATLAELRLAAADLDLELPADDARCERLLTQAEGDVAVHALGTRVLDLDLLTPAQRGALARATVRQAIWRANMDGSDLLGVQDNLAAVGGITFSRDPVPRFSPAALEEVALHGLIRRAPMAPAPLPLD
jgi:hypothetical protein